MISTRTFSGEDDIQSMLDLLIAVRPAARITVYPGLVDLREILALSTVRANTRLWFGIDDRLVAFAIVDHYHNLWFEFDPQLSPRNIGTEIVAWGEKCVRRSVLAGADTLTLRASCRDDDAERLALFAQHGFVMRDWHVLRMVRALDEPIPAPRLPDGFRIRHVAGEDEVEALVALHRAAFGTENMTVEERLAMMRVPDYDLKLDLLVVAPDGRFAAYCMCSVSQEENARTGRKEGYTDPIATHPDYQRQGLARALLFAGFRKLKQYGMDTVALGTSSENVAMQKLAQAVGFRVRSKKLQFSKLVRNGAL